MNLEAPFERVQALRYVTVENAPAYRAIMQVCFDALQHYRIELRPHDILQDLQRSGFDLGSANVEMLETQYLQQLVRWGNLTDTADTAGVSRLEDFYRRRLVYHVTDVGEAAHRAVLDVEAAIGRSGSLQATMLVKIRDCLHAVAKAGERGDPDTLLGLLHDLHGAFDTLTHEANRFMTELGALVGDAGEETSDAGFHAFKEAVLVYISRFVEELRRLRDGIVAGIGAVRTGGIERIVGLASQSADLPDFAGDGTARRRWSDEQLVKWAGIVAWFSGDERDAEPTVDRLAGFAVGAVVSLTRTLARLNDRRGRPVDRTTDFLTLARWFAECESDEAAHELWHVAFGLHGARHLYVTEEDPDATSTRTSWWDADPVLVPTRLRTHGRLPTQGRSARAADYSKEREWLAARARRERAQVEAAIERFRGRDLRLSDVAELDAREFDLLLELLDGALAIPAGIDGTRATRTSDGRLHILLTRPPDGATCVLTPPGGRLVCADYRLEVTDLVRPASPREATEESTA